MTLHKGLNNRGLNPATAEWFADAIETGVIKLPELQAQYQNLQVQGLQYNFQDMQYRKQELERYLQYNQQRIMEQTD